MRVRVVYVDMFGYFHAGVLVNVIVLTRVRMVALAGSFVTKCARVNWKSMCTSGGFASSEASHVPIAGSTRLYAYLAPWSIRKML